MRHDAKRARHDPQASIWSPASGAWLALFLVLAVSKDARCAERDATALSIEREVRRIASGVSLWPGFEPLVIPLAVYTGESTALFRHPAPPKGFRPMHTDSSVFAFQGRHAAVTSNSSAEMGGTATATLLADGARAEADSTALAATAMHEAFHVFQRAKHPSWSGNEGDLLLYPSEDPSLLALRRLETRALAEALADSGSAASACWARLALWYRRQRFDRMDTAFSTYERRTELNEGLASYVQHLALGDTTVAIPKHGFAPAAIRDRTYVSGPALAFLLDRHATGWQSSLEADGEQDLDVMLAAAVGFEAGTTPACNLGGGEIAEIERRAEADAKAVVAARGERRKAFEARPGWRLVVEAADGQPLWPQGFDPLNVERVEGGLLHTRFLELGNDAGSVRVLEETGIDLESLTVGAGEHPLFQGVSQVVVTGLPQLEAVREDGRVGVVAPGLTLRFHGAKAEVRGTEMWVRISARD